MHKIMKRIFIVIALLSVMGCSDEKDEKFIKVSGTVANTLLVAENSTLKHKIITLSNGLEYKLTPEQGKGIGNKFAVKLTLNENSNNNEVHSVKIISIPHISGRNE